MSGNSDKGRRTILKNIGGTTAALSFLTTAKGEGNPSTDDYICPPGGCGGGPNAEWQFESDHTRSSPAWDIPQKLGLGVTYFGSTYIPSSGYWQHDIRFSGTGGEDASDYSYAEEKLERIGYELTAVDTGVEFADVTIDDWSGVYPEDEDGSGEELDVESAATTVLSASVGVVNPALGLGLSAVDIANDLNATNEHTSDDHLVSLEHAPQSCSTFLGCNPKDLDSISFYQRGYVKTESIVSNPQFEVRAYLDDGFENDGKDYSQDITVEFETFEDEHSGVDDPVETSAYSDNPAKMTKEQRQILDIEEFSPDDVGTMNASQTFIAENYAEEDDVLYSADIPFGVTVSNDE